MEDRFSRDAATAASLDHPHIVPIYRFGATAHLLWYSMKYVEGRSLADILLSAIPEALAGVAGVMYGLWLLNIKGTMGFLPGIKAFTAAVLGGIGNIPGAMAGGFLIGLAESVGREQLNSVFNPVLHWIGAGGLGLGNEWKDVVAFFVLIGVLLLRPTGIFGEVVAKRA